MRPFEDLPKKIFWLIFTTVFALFTFSVRQCYKNSIDETKQIGYLIRYNKNSKKIDTELKKYNEARENRIKDLGYLHRFLKENNVEILPNYINLSIVNNNKIQTKKDISIVSTYIKTDEEPESFYTVFNEFFNRELICWETAHAYLRLIKGNYSKNEIDNKLHEFYSSFEEYILFAGTFENKTSVIFDRAKKNAIWTTVKAILIWLLFVSSLFLVSRT